MFQFSGIPRYNYNMNSSRDNVHEVLKYGAFQQMLTLIWNLCCKGTKASQ
jgi:hypothetical protein